MEVPNIWWGSIVLSISYECTLPLLCALRVGAPGLCAPIVVTPYYVVAYSKWIHWLRYELIFGKESKPDE